MLCRLFFGNIPCYIAGVMTWQAAPGMPVLKLLLLLYIPLLVLLPKHLMKGTWTGRTITTNGSLLLVVGAKMRTPWLLYWRARGSLTSIPKSLSRG